MSLPNPRISGRDSGGILYTCIALYLVALIAFPILEPALLSVVRLPGSFISYAYPLASVALLLGAVRLAENGRGFDRFGKFFLIFCGYCTLVLLFKVLVNGEFSRVILRTLMIRSYAFVISGAVVLCLLLPTTERIQRRVSQVFIGGIVVLFLVQFLCAIPEARGREIVRKTAIMAQLDKDEIMDGRDVLASSSGVSYLRRLGFVRPMTGGFNWFNEYGVMLVFYNLVFLSKLTERVRLWWLPLLVLVLVAAVLNTTKTAIAVILVSDVLVAAWLFPGFRLLWSFLGVVMIIAMGAFAAERFMNEAGGLNTLMVRWAIWGDFLQYFVREVLPNPLAFLFGVSFAEVEAPSPLTYKYVYGSVENEGISVIFFYGAIGLCLNLWTFLGPLFSRITYVDMRRRIILFLVPLSMFLCGLTMDSINRYFSLPLIAFLVMNCRAARGGMELCAREVLSPSRVGSPFRPRRFPGFCPPSLLKS